MRGRRGCGDGDGAVGRRSRSRAARHGKDGGGPEVRQARPHSGGPSPPVHILSTLSTATKVAYRIGCAANLGIKATLLNQKKSNCKL